MTQNTPLSSHPVRLPAHVEQRVLSVEELKAHGVSPARAAAQCRDGAADLGDLALALLVVLVPVLHALTLVVLH
ncbi:hypothetical protein [Streptomyces sp. NPDC002346]